MERPQNINITPRTAIIVIILFHFVGLVGLSVPTSRPLFLQLVPWHLLLMLLVLLTAHTGFIKQSGIFLLIMFVAGFAAEWVGVHQHWLFGNYTYGQTLGLKLLDIPLTIGINWFMLVYAAGVTMQRSRLKSTFFRVITGALLLVVLDVLIEPVAIRFNYWAWAGNSIPIKNYVCWFFVGAALLYVFELFKFKKQSIAAPVLLITQFVFFVLLNLVTALT
ncbi:carotenoid biosynthesis protein [Inquilinus sp. KBS0705]|nr:carotenoid biosynthesis protein [Inquilinus sp. KBS0705]